MARNRKRAKERRARRPQSAVASARTDRDGARAADGGRAADAAAAEQLRAEQLEDAAAAEQLRAEQLEDARTALGGGDEDARTALGGGDEDGAPNPLEHVNPDLELADAQIALGGGARLDQAELDREQELLEEDIEDQRHEHAVPAVADHKPRLVTRLIGFLEGSWRELQRVQWPDRRQVVQATSVVIGFVIVAGLFLGLSDLVSQKLVNFILK